MKIRYEFWSLIVALKSGLIHGDTSPTERATRIVDNLVSLELAERNERLKHLGVLVEYLQSIQAEVANRQTAATCETRHISPG